MKLLAAKDFGLTIEPVYVERMKIACDYVENNVTDEDFLLDNFRGPNDNGHIPRIFEVLNNGPSCGTVGCFVGHAIHTITDKDLLTKHIVEDSWFGVSEHLSGVDFWANGAAWRYLFGELSQQTQGPLDEAKWHEYLDNENIESIHESRLGTIERIRHFYGIEE